ncbi:hypothetical protein PHYPSEUDO_004273 [Phytophthora pseudosyringae]|uniref:Uncharacterized protein n=1 Tax=Phytophthora pseudosyringae TaxID=221518 RepID=A0A8T1VTQ6_9STRA|nr:hypothetical protein PHYPSEUDO_004273 [Phytophthora pseudosyringae]
MGYADIVQFLVSRGAILDLRLPSGGTALITAVWHKRLAVVRVLLNGGADITLCGDFKCWPPLTVAYFCGYIEFVHFMFARLPADYYANVEQQLSPLGSLPSPTIDQKHRNGDTSLRIASEQGLLKVVEALLESTDDMNVSNSSDWTPLTSASWKGHLEIVVALVKMGASINLPGLDEATALQAACSVNHLHVVAFLVEKGASIDRADKNGDTPLMEAAKKGYAPVVQFSVGKGASVNLANNAGETPLLIASQNSRADIMKVLLEKMES